MPRDSSNRQIDEMRRLAAGCTRCDLHENATQTVFGEGPASARVVLVGEQPGDREDREGHPFVGPAGHMLDKALEDAVIDRSQVYVTNAVKHFKWESKGKRRIHKKPNAEQMRACRPWLDGELSVLRPQIVVCLGATAAQSVIGKGAKVTEIRGTFVDSPVAPRVTATVHPSSILRARDDDARREAYDAFVEDLRVVARELASLGAARARGATG